MSFPSYYANLRPHARLTSPLFLVWGVAMIGLGLLAQRTGYWLFGVAMTVCGLGNWLVRVRLDRGSVQPLMVGMLITSVVGAVMSLVVQMREHRRRAPRP